MRWRRGRRGASLEELERVYRTGYPAFHRVAAAITGDGERANDAVHEAFVRAVRHRARFDGTGALEGWIWRIVVNEARRKQKPLPQPDFGQVPSENGHAEQARVRALIAALPERQRHALFLRYYADLDYAAIADALEVAPGTVAATLNAAHAALRPKLEVER